MPPLIQKSNETPYTSETKIYGWYEENHAVAVFQQVSSQFPDTPFLLRGETLDFSIWVGFVPGQVQDMSAIQQAVVTAHQMGDPNGPYKGIGPRLRPWELPSDWPPLVIPKGVR